MEHDRIIKDGEGTEREIYTWKFIIHDKLIVYRCISRLDHKYTNIYHKLTIMVLDILVIPECNNG